MPSDIREHSYQSGFTMQRILVQNKNLLFNTMECHKYSPGELISQFTAPNETVRKNYFDQYWRTRS